jgi:hypothetical protein
MGGLNPAIQLAAALDKRGITVSIDGDRVHAHIGYRNHMIIKPCTEGVKSHQFGREWSWSHGGESGLHPRGDYDGAAQAIDKTLRSLPALEDTRLLYRMNHIGWTWAQESDEALERARRINEERRQGKQAGAS